MLIPLGQFTKKLPGTRQAVVAQYGEWAAEIIELAGRADGKAHMEEKNGRPFKGIRLDRDEYRGLDTTVLEKHLNDLGILFIWMDD